MRVEQVVVQILINAKKAKDSESALRIIKTAFPESLPNQTYESWNTEIDESVAQKLIDNAKQRDKIIPSILIQDLSTIAKSLLSISSLYFIS